MKTIEEVIDYNPETVFFAEHAPDHVYMDVDNLKDNLLLWKDSGYKKPKVYIANVSDIVTVQSGMLTHVAKKDEQVNIDKLWEEITNADNK
jgi:hypothetical protein